MELRKQRKSFISSNFDVGVPLKRRSLLYEHEVQREIRQRGKFQLTVEVPDREITETIGLYIESFRF